MTIPAKERLKVLRFCDKVNLHEFTLFDSEEGLLEMQAMRVSPIYSSTANERSVFSVVHRGFAETASG